MPLRVRIAPESQEALKALYESELCRRRCFVAGVFELQERERCLLLVEHPAGSKSFEVEAEAVYVRRDEPGAGVGLELVGLNAARLAELEAFVSLSSSSRARADELAHPRSLPERIRNLSLREREAVARQGTLSERVALERLFGSHVWETLLQNPQLSVPEVAHIAKNGTIPVPLLAVIVANSGWLASGEVRRAILGNPRASSAQIERVLRATPRSEVRLIAQMSPFRVQVRAAAKKMIGES